jgi:hypothetical protein
MISKIIDGVLYIPKYAETDDITGDAFIPIDKNDPEYEYWLNLAEEYETKRIY